MKKYKIFVQKLNRLLNDSISKIKYGIDHIDSINVVLEKFEYRSMCVRSNGTIGIIKSILDGDIIEIEFEMKDRFILNLDFTSLLSDSEIVDYISFIDESKISIIVNPLHTFGRESVELPLNIFRYKGLPTSSKNEIRNLIKMLDCYQRDIKINEIID